MEGGKGHFLPQYHFLFFPTLLALVPGLLFLPTGLGYGDGTGNPDGSIPVHPRQPMPWVERKSLDPSWERHRQEQDELEKVKESHGWAQPGHSQREIPKEGG